MGTNSGWTRGPGRARAPGQQWRRRLGCFHRMEMLSAREKKAAVRPGTWWLDRSTKYKEHLILSQVNQALHLLVG